MGYHYLTLGKSKAERIELDLALAGGDEAPPEEIGKANQQAMAALGGVGAVGKRKRRRS